MQPQTDEQRGKRACALTARGSISKAMKGLVGGAAEGSADCRKNWTTALFARSSGTHPTSAERAEAARAAWGGGFCFEDLTGDLLEECRFLLNTQLMFLKKEKDPTLKQFHGDEWIRSLTEASEITADVPEDSVLYDQQAVDLKKVRPIQMGEFLRKYVSRRLLALCEGEIAALTTAMRQLGVGSQGGAEALAIFHQLLYDEWISGSLTEPLARIKVDEQNFFGMMEWDAVRDAASRFLPKHTAVAAWKHRNLSHVEQEGFAPMPKDR